MTAVKQLQAAKFLANVDDTHFRCPSRKFQKFHTFPRLIGLHWLPRSIETLLRPYVKLYLLYFSCPISLCLSRIVWMQSSYPFWRFLLLTATAFSSVLWHCWLGHRKCMPSSL